MNVHTGYLTPDVNATPDYRCGVLSIPNHLTPYVYGALAELLDPLNWDELGTMTVDDVIAELALIIDAFEMTESGCMIGEIKAFMRDSLPDWFLPMDGTTYDDTDYPKLWSVLPNALKSGQTFTLPNLTDHHLRGGTGASDIGTLDGASAVTLTVAQLPSHTHQYIPPTINPDVEGPGIPDIGATILGSLTDTLPTGSGEPVDITPLGIRVVYGIRYGP